MAEQRMYGFKMSRSVVIFCCAAIVVTLMALVVADHLVDTYGHASILVTVLASLIVAVTHNRKMLLPDRGGQRPPARGITFVVLPGAALFRAPMRCACQ